MSEFTDSEIEEMRAYEIIATFIDYKIPHCENPVVEINKKIEREIRRTKTMIEVFDEELEE